MSDSDGEGKQTGGRKLASKGVRKLCVEGKWASNMPYNPDFSGPEEARAKDARKRREREARQTAGTLLEWVAGVKDNTDAEQMKFCEMLVRDVRSQ